MTLSRRGFFKTIAAGGAVLGGAAASAHERPPGYPESFAVLVDTTRCVGCRSCEAACNSVNDLAPPEQPFDDLSVLDEKRSVGVNNFTVINRYDVKLEDGTTKTVYRKIQCNHCMEPCCASACFVKAFKKTPDGPVLYDPDVCVGCRYCLLACPFYALSYEYDEPLTPRVLRCTMCVDRIAEGKLPGCVGACPMEALTFGKRDDLLHIARERIRNNPDRYVNYIYGEHEVGGQNWLHLTGVPPETIGLPTVGTNPPAELTSGALSMVPVVVGTWPVLLTGIYAINKRKEKIAGKEKADAVADAEKAVTETMTAKMNAAAEKAKKDKEAAIAREVKKAVADAEKAAAEAASSGADDAGKKKGEEDS